MNSVTGSIASPAPSHFTRYFLPGLAGVLALLSVVVVLGLLTQWLSLVDRKAQLTAANSAREEEGERLARAYAEHEPEWKRLAKDNAEAAAHLEQLEAEYVRGESTMREIAQAMGQREAAAKKAAELKNHLNAMVMDLILLGRTDADAQEIVQKHGIKQSVQSER